MKITLPATPSIGIAILCAFIACIALMSAPSQAQSIAKYVEGTHYQVIASPVKTADPSKIEITEVFWYGCPHCNRFHPIFENWKKQQGNDVLVGHSPAIWSKPMIVHAHMFYTAKALRVQDKMHSEFFDAMHKERKKLVSKKSIFKLFEKHGVTQETFDKTFDSFGIKAQVQQASARARGYGITGTPEVIVNGKYRISGRMVRSQAEVLQVANFLIAKERAAAKKS
jgi:thiol:disulfide interchange protein DsbA